jgi:hypothetical protein
LVEKIISPFFRDLITIPMFAVKKFLSAIKFDISFLNSGIEKVLIDTVVSEVITLKVSCAKELK